MTTHIIKSGKDYRGPVEIGDNLTVTQRADGVTRLSGEAGGAAAPFYDFALFSEDNNVYFYHRSGRLLSTYRSGMPIGYYHPMSMCATRRGTVWVCFTPPNPAKSVLVEIQPVDGSVIQTIALTFRCVEDAYTLRQMAERADGNLIVQYESEVWQLNTHEVPPTIGSGLDHEMFGAETGSDPDFEINRAGTFMVIVDDYDLLLYDIVNDTSSVIKTFDNKIAWPRWLEDGTVIVEMSSSASDQSYSINGTPTSGTFTITFRGQTTAPIAFNATGAQVIAAMELLSTIGAGNVREYPGYESAGLPATIYPQFCGDLKNQAIETFTITDSTDGALVVAEDVAGSDSVYDDSAGQFSNGDFLRIDLDGNLLQTYKYDRLLPDMSSEGLYGFSASVRANRLWVYGEIDAGAGRTSASYVITGTPTTGTYTITFRGKTTRPIFWDAEADDVVAALEALSTIGRGNVLVVMHPDPGNLLAIYFQEWLAGQSISVGPTVTDGTDGGLAVADNTAGGDEYEPGEVAALVIIDLTTGKTVDIISQFQNFGDIDEDRSAAVITPDFSEFDA